MKVCVIGLAIACLVASGQSITDQDIAYGWNTHKQIAAQYQFINERAQAETVARVFDRLCQTRIGRSSPVAPSVFYIHDPEIQAFATGGGRVYITDGFVNGTGADERVMAFALSHEMAHNLRQHGIESALRRMAFEEQVAYFKRRIALGDNKAGWELLAYVAAERTISAKLDRDQESEADHLGMLMSADAGFTRTS